MQKLILLLFILCAGTTYAQDVTIRVKNNKMSAGEVIRSVEAQTPYNFSYNRNMYDTARIVLLPQTALPLAKMLECMVKDTEVNYMIHGKYIVFIPTNSNPRSQLRRQATTSRTSDVYVPSNPNELNASSLRRPVTETTEAVGVEEIEPEPEKEYYSDYHPIDIHGNVQTSLPRFAIKTNLLYGLSTLTPNLSVEVALSGRSTLELSYSSNPWKHDADLDDNKKLLHGIASLEYRYWLCERYSGHFFGIHALYSEYNISGYTIPLLFKKDYRYKGNAYGGGVLYGYALPIGKMWNIEFTGGFDALRMDYKRYGCRTCDTNSEPFKKTRFVPSAGINIVFLIK